jgi:hypothetical protein
MLTTAGCIGEENESVTSHSKFKRDKQVQSQNVLLSSLDLGTTITFCTKDFWSIDKVENYSLRGL